MKPERSRTSVPPGATALLAAVALAGLVLTWRMGLVTAHWLDVLEGATLDARFRTRGDLPLTDTVVLIAFDEKTRAECPTVLDRRADLAPVFDTLAALGPKAIGVDLVFPNPEEVLPADLVADIDVVLDAGGHGDADAVLARVRDQTRGDERLAASMDAAGHVVLGFHVGAVGTPPGKEVGRGKYGQNTDGEHPALWLGDNVLASDILFARSASRLGVVTVVEDPTKSVRAIPLGVQLGESTTAPFAVQLVAEYDGVSRGVVAWRADLGGAQVGDRMITGDGASMLLDWRGTPFPVVSVADLLAGRVDPALIKDKIAILGVTSLGQDTVNTPFGLRSGFEVHATAIDQILRGTTPHRIAPIPDAAWSLLVGALVSAVFAVKGLGPRGQVAGSLVAGFGALAAAQYVFDAKTLWITMSGPVLVGGGAAAAGLATAYLQEGLQRAWLRRTFAHYLSDDLVSELVADPSRVSLRGERRRLTVLFTDVRNFTTYSERISAEDLAEFLRAYFGPMTRAVLSNEGYVDKFIGDAVMALFGAPLRREAHAASACKAALKMHAELVELKPIAEKYGIDLQIGAGINTGEMVVGNLGSAERFDYSVLGDAVNLASRLEGLTKTSSTGRIMPG